MGIRREDELIFEVLDKEKQIETLEKELNKETKKHNKILKWKENLKNKIKLRIKEEGIDENGCYDFHFLSGDILKILFESGLIPYKYYSKIFDKENL